MKYKYYGTAAAEGIPALMCECAVCEEAKKKGGRNIMSRSQQTIDGKILIDFPADTFMHMLQGLPIEKIHTCIITHDHSDHFYPEDVLMRNPAFAHLKDDAPLEIYATKPACEHCESIIPEWMGSADFVRMHEIKPFVSFEAEGYKITPLAANHAVHLDPVIFLIEKDGKCVLHANDTGYFPQETLDFLEKYPVHIDFASFDCTESLVEEHNCEKGNHMNYVTVKNLRSKLKEMGRIDDKTICVINHFSHNGGCVYDSLCELAEKDGFAVSYDGLEIEF